MVIRGRYESFIFQVFDHWSSRAQIEIELEIEIIFYNQNLYYF